MRNFLFIFTLLAMAGNLGHLPAANSADKDKPGILNVCDFGAVPDGKTLSTTAIQRALDSCAAQGGGTVVIPPGVFLTAGLVLGNKTTLKIDDGATLLGSTRSTDYQGRRNIIYAKGARDISIIGPGVIDGQSPGNWHKISSFPPDKEYRRKFGWVPHHFFTNGQRAAGGLFFLEGCRNVVLNNLTLKNSGGWTVHLLGCSQVKVDQVRIRNPLDGPTLDGIDVQACQDVSINHCDVFTSDDAICLKNRHPDYPQPERNITVADCTLTTTCNAFKIGTETHGDFENIHVSNLTIQGADANDPLAKEAAKTIDPEHYGDALAPLSGIAIESVDGSHIRDVTIENVHMKDVRAPIFIRLSQRGILPYNPKAGKPGRTSAKAPVGGIESIVIRNVTATGASCASSITGIPGHSVDNIQLSNIAVTTIPNPGLNVTTPIAERADTYPEATMWGPLPCYGLFVRHVQNLSLTNVTFTPQPPESRPPVIQEDVKTLSAPAK